jgi:hypothetical protein
MTHVWDRTATGTVKKDSIPCIQLVSWSVATLYEQKTRLDSSICRNRD